MAVFRRLNVRRLAEVPGSKTLTLIIGLALICTLAFFLWLRVFERQLAPYGIVAFEFALTPTRAREIIRAWGDLGLAAARQSLWVDFGFMLAYAFLFAGLTLTAARAAPSGWQPLGWWLTLAPFVAWDADAIENLALLSVLRAPNDPFGPALALAGAAAALKFSLLLLCLLYILGVLAVRIVQRLRR